MKYQLTAGTEVLELAAALAETTTGLENLSVDGAFLTFTLPGTSDEAKAVITQIGDTVSTLRDEAAEADEPYGAYTALMNFTMGLLRDIDRDFNGGISGVAKTLAVSEATGAKQESQPTGVKDSSISLSSQQSSEAKTNEEPVNEAQQQQGKSKTSGSDGRNRSN